jgi:hypothetical protein
MWVPFFVFNSILEQLGPNVCGPPYCCETKVRGLDISIVAQSTIYCGALLPEAWLWVAARPLGFPKYGLERMAYL